MRSTPIKCANWQSKCATTHICSIFQWANFSLLPRFAHLCGNEDSDLHRIAIIFFHMCEGIVRNLQWQWQWKWHVKVQSKKIRISKEKCNHCWKVSPPHHHNESSMRLAAWLKFQTKSRAIIIEIFYFLGCVCASVLSKIPSIFYSNIPCAASKQSGRMFRTFASQCFDRYHHYHFHRAHL